MLQLIAAATIGGCLSIQSAPVAGGDPAAQAVPAEQAIKSELTALAKKLESAASWTLTYRMTGSGKTGGKAQKPDPKPAQGDAAARDVWTVQFQRDHAMYFTKGHAEFYRREHRFVALGRNDEWTTIELPPQTEGTAPRGEKLRGLARMAFEVDRIPLPTEVLAALDGKITAVTRTEVDGKVDYVATLTKETVREMMGGGKGGKAEPGERKPPDAGAPAGPAPAWSGTLHVLASRDVIERFEVDLKSTTAAGERTVRREYCLSGLDATEVKVPDPAAKLLAEDD